MSMPSFFIAIFIFFLILSPPVTTTKGPKITAMVVAESRLLAGLKPNDQMTMFKPEGRKSVFHSKAVDNCMPKGKRHSSAPSHYINYHTFGSTGCDKIDTP